MACRRRATSGLCSFSNADTLCLQRVDNKWATISGQYLQARTDNSVKNHWNSTLKRHVEEWRKHVGDLDKGIAKNHCREPGPLGDNRFVTGRYTLEQLQDMIPIPLLCSHESPETASSRLQVADNITAVTPAAKLRTRSRTPCRYIISAAIAFH